MNQNCGLLKFQGTVWDPSNNGNKIGKCLTRGGYKNFSNSELKSLTFKISAKMAAECAWLGFFQILGYIIENRASVLLLNVMIR